LLKKKKKNILQDGVVRYLRKKHTKTSLCPSEKLLGAQIFAPTSQENV